MSGLNWQACIHYAIIQSPNFVNLNLVFKYIINIATCGRRGVTYRIASCFCFVSLSQILNYKAKKKKVYVSGYMPKKIRVGR